MNRFAATASVVALLGALVVGLGNSAAASTANMTGVTEPGATQMTAAGANGAATARRHLPVKRWARELVRRGDRDKSPKRIEHVRELQYRLRWAGVYHKKITGHYGKSTQRAVRRYQGRHHLPRTGKANRRTWRKLIPDTVRGRSSIPGSCKKPGWHACYDRRRHQVTLWRGGRIYNSWLVRGGNARHKTRKGRFTVFRRSRHHVSSIYGVKMPYAQFFSGGEAFHASYAMVDPFRGHSHGCVNMYIKDARQLWKLTAHKRLHVRVYGRWS